MSTQAKNKKQVHYPNLNALRCIAACSVIIAHIETIKKDNGLPSYYSLHSLVFLLSKIGVDLFFVLSGFLITSLLLIERSQFNTVSIKTFYIKRMLRIWPLYFLIVGLSIFLFPHLPLMHYPNSHFFHNPYDHLWGNILLFIFFLPNVQAFVNGSILFSAQTWSIGLEEQYYLFWPWIMKKVKSIKKVKVIVISFVTILVVTQLALHVLAPRLHNASIITAYDFLKHYPIDTIFIGCYFGILNSEEKIKGLLTKKSVQIACYAILAICLVSRYQFKGFYWEAYAILFGIMILNLVNKTSIISLEFKPLNYLGKISYGMYMYHMIFVVLIIRGITTNNVLIYILTFVFTIILSAISYELFEKKLLSLKERISRVKSSDT